jgi:hypothetical protein
LDFLREHRNGASHDELSDALQELVAAVTEEGKAGTLTLKITVKPANAGQGALLVVDEIKTAPPKTTKSGSIFFASPDNNLVREDPRQPKLDLREIGPAAAHKGIA